MSTMHFNSFEEMCAFALGQKKVETLKKYEEPKKEPKKATAKKAAPKKTTKKK